MRYAVAAALVILVAAGGCESPLCPDDVTVGTALRDYRTNPVAKNHDWSIDYASVQFRWRLKPERVRGD